jgi:hypothetical protein
VKELGGDESHLHVFVRVRRVGRIMNHVLEKTKDSNFHLDDGD